jgi:hypothetical protein
VIELPGKRPNAWGGAVVGSGIGHRIDVGEHCVAVALEVRQEIPVGVALGANQSGSGQQHHETKQAHVSSSANLKVRIS